MLFIKRFKRIDGSAMFNDLTGYYFININACERQPFVRRLYSDPLTLMGSFHDEFRNSEIM